MDNATENWSSLEEVVKYIGVTKDTISSIRISYGRHNTMDEINIIIATICDACNKIKSNQ